MRALANPRGYEATSSGAIGLQTRAGMAALAPPRAPGTPAVGQPPMAGPGGGGRKPAQFVPDATYLAQAAQQQFQRTSALNRISEESQTGRQSRDEAVRRVLEGLPQALQQTNQEYNKAGLFYSGQLGKARGEIETAIGRQRADIQNAFAAEERARQVERAAIQQGEPLETAALRAAAVERALTRDAEAASQNQLARNPRPKARPKPKPKPKPKPRPRRRRNRR